MKIPYFLLWKKPPEHSISYRVVTLVTVMCGILAILSEQQWPPFGWVVVGATVLGFWVSYHRREHTNWFLKIILSFLMLAALWDFFVNLVDNPYDPRIPLANLLLWLQVLHSYDLPARRDLNYSLLVGFILVSVAGVLSTDMTYVPFLFVFMMSGVLTMHYSYLSQAREGAETIGTMPGFGALSGNVARLSFSMLAVGVLAYCCIPRFEGMRIRPLPISFQRFGFPKSPKESRKAGYPGTPGALRGGQRKFDPDNYFGFNSYLDLNLRGRLSDEVVMRVRSSEWSYYRGLAFNHYSGEGWEITEEDLQKATAAMPPIMIEGGPPGDREVVQTFYIEKDMSNVLFSAYHLNQLYWLSDTVYVDAQSGVRAPYPLESGMVYSAISRYRAPSPDVIRKVSVRRRRRPSDMYRRVAAIDLQLPQTVPQRVYDLAHQVSDRVADPYHKALAIDTFLQTRYTYSLDIPPFEKGRDVADEFLFDIRKGYCEQFATAMTVMCRCVGVPARVVTGYAPGTYNPFTGMYEVRGTEAHAWVEAFVDGFGWLQFDPSPGYQGAPQMERQTRSHWVAGPMLEYLAGQLGGGTIGFLYFVAKIQDWIAAKLGVVGARVLALIAFWVVSFLIAIWLGNPRKKSGAKGGLAPLWSFSQALSDIGGAARALATRLLSPRPSPPPPNPVFSAYHQMLATLQRRGCSKSPAQTPREFAQQAAQAVPQAREPIEILTEQFVLARYSHHPPAPDETLNKLSQFKHILSASSDNNV